MANTTKTSIHPILEADVPAHGELLRDAKLELTINRLLFNDWPNDEAQRPVYEGAVRGGFNDPATESWKVVDDETGAMVGYLSLTRKTPSKDAAPRNAGNGPPKAPEGMNEEVFRTVIALVSSLETLLDVDHFDLTHIYVKPTYRRKGIGSQLVRIAVDKAIEAGIPFSVCSEPAAHDFFFKLGFKDTVHGDIDLRKWAPENSGFGNFRLYGMVLDK